MKASGFVGARVAVQARGEGVYIYIYIYIYSYKYYTPGSMNSLFGDFFREFWRGILVVFETT